ncbi:hypothetical protein [Lysinibacillus sp. fls2-241-R2A-57]|uniref:hypothetical protein n=1 Tax=Lysinibacillus sp. fls2-241-R2A-57 TaxID=3040292 RepID=UPI002555A74E|nr:hypothetical protein [Lysinibacillus sp. fls2-241-R2A-57]
MEWRATRLPWESETGETLHGAQAEEAARRSPTGSSALRESVASATKRVAWNGNQLHFF